MISEKLHLFFQKSKSTNEQAHSHFSTLESPAYTAKLEGRRFVNNSGKKIKN